jgi:drug/metabolite transporter (DMT)-like permease
MGVLLALISAFSFASSYVLIRAGVRPSDPDNGLMITMLVNVAMLTVGAILLPFFLPLPPITLPAIGWFVGAGLFGPLIGRNALFASIRLIGSTRGAALKNNAPIVVVILAITFLDERFTPQAMLGIGLVIGGLLMLAYEAFTKGPPGEARLVEPIVTEGLIADGPSGETVATTWTQRLAGPTIAGISTGLIAAVAFGVSQTCRALGIAEMPNAVLGSAIGVWVGLLSYSAVVASQGRLTSMLRFNLRHARPLLWLAGVATTSGNIAFYLAVTMAPISYVSVVSASETIITLLLGALVLRRVESISSQIVLPAFAIFGGTALIALG